MTNSRLSERGITLPELMITALVVGIFFAAIFEVSAVCFRYISSSKENIAAIECVQDRVEQLRNTNFDDLIDPNYMAVAPAAPAASPLPTPPQRRNLTTPANASELGTYATETVWISTFDGATAMEPKVCYVRGPGARISATPNSDTNVTPSTSWVGASSTLAGATMVQIDVTYSWKATFGGRQRSETSSTVVATGLKK